MKKIEVRGTLKGLLLINVILSVGFIAFCIYGIFILSAAPIEVVLLMIPYVGSIMLLGIGALIEVIVGYLSKIRICDNKVTIIHPFRKTVTLSISDITYWGCAARVPNLNYLYFSNVNEDEMFAYLQANWKACYRIFGNKCVESAKASDKGMLQLAIGTYIFNTPARKRENMHVVKMARANDLQVVANAMGCDAMLTGRGAMQFDAWEKLAKYDPNGKYSTAEQGDDSVVP